MDSVLENVRYERFNQQKHSVDRITDLLHEAYEPLYKAGLHYYAATQSPKATLWRFLTGIGFVAMLKDEIIGTVTYYSEYLDDDCSWYKRKEVCHFGQFAVQRRYQRQGIGRALIEMMERKALNERKKELALDTSEKAEELIEYYERRGFRKVDLVQWDVTNYRSIVMSKTLEAKTTATSGG